MTTEEPKKSPMQMAGEVARAAELETVSMRSWSAAYLPAGSAPPELPGPAALDVAHDVRFALDRSAKVLDLEVEYHLVGKDKDDGAGQERVRIDLAIVLRYRFDTVPDLPEAYFRHFSELNGVMNAWPYVRELVHSSTARMGLPPLVLPLLKASRLKPPRAPKK